MSTYRCTECREPRVPDLQQVAEIVGGLRWWTVENVDALQADVVHRMVKAGHCARHAILVGALFRMEIQRERDHRTVPPGEVRVRRVIILDPPFEVVTGKRFRKVLAQVRNFVAGTLLSAVVEYDKEERRIRITFQLLDDQQQPSATLDTLTLGQTNAQALIELMRNDARRRLEQVG